MLKQNNFHVLLLYALITVSVVCFALMLFLNRDGTSEDSSNASDGGLADGTYEGVYVSCEDRGESVTDGLVFPFVGRVTITRHVWSCTATLPDSTVTHELNLDVDTSTKAWFATEACERYRKVSKGDIVVDSSGYDQIKGWLSCVDDLSVEVDHLEE